MRCQSAGRRFQRIKRRPLSRSMRTASSGFIALRPVRHWYRYCSLMPSCAANAMRSAAGMPLFMRLV